MPVANACPISLRPLSPPRAPSRGHDASARTASWSELRIAATSSCQISGGNLCSSKPQTQSPNSKPQSLTLFGSTGPCTARPGRCKIGGRPASRGSCVAAGKRVAVAVEVAWLHRGAGDEFGHFLIGIETGFPDGFLGQDVDGEGRPLAVAVETGGHRRRRGGVTAGVGDDFKRTQDNARGRAGGGRRLRRRGRCQTQGKTAGDRGDRTGELPRRGA